MRAAVIFAAAVAASATVAPTFTTLSQAEPTEGQRFGVRVAVASENRYFVAGSRCFDTFNGGFTYFLNGKSTVIDGLEGETLGSSIAATETTLIVGAIGEATGEPTGNAPPPPPPLRKLVDPFLYTGEQNINGVISGGARVYNIGANGELTQVGTFKVPEAKADAMCGNVVAIDANTAVMSCKNEDSVYVFTRSGSQWGAGIKLESTTLSNFGHYYVAVSGDFIAVAGLRAVEVFQRSSGAWTSVAVLKSSTTTGAFGKYVSLKGTLLTIGDPAVGNAVFYRLGSGAPTVEFTATIPFPSTGSRFGRPIAIGEQNGREVVYISADDSVCGTGASVTSYEQKCLTQSGTVYIFTNRGATGTPAWALSSAVKSTEPQANGNFGVSLAAFKNVLVVGAPGAGAAQPTPVGPPPPRNAARPFESGIAYALVFPPACDVFCNSCVSSPGTTVLPANAAVGVGAVVQCLQGTYPTTSTAAKGLTCAQSTIEIDCVASVPMTDEELGEQVNRFTDEAALIAWLVFNGRIFFRSALCLDCKVHTSIPELLVSKCWVGCLTGSAAQRQDEEEEELEFLQGQKTVVCKDGVTAEECARAGVCEGVLLAGGDCGNFTCPDCTDSSSKKGLLGLLGLLGLIPLLLCCCLLWLCCIRRRKADPEVHFATFDPFAQESIGVGAVPATTYGAGIAPTFCPSVLPEGTILTARP